MEMELIPIETDVDAIDWHGKPIKIRRVQALRDNATGKIWLDPAKTAKAELRQLAESLSIHPRQLPLLLMLYAQPGSTQRGYVHNKYKLNKMLFYQWKGLEKDGLGETYEHDEFIGARKGPIPKNLYDDLAELNTKGLIELSGGPEERRTLEAQLTTKGVEIARSAFNYVAPVYNEITQKVKTELFPLDPKTIMDQVHKDYPEFQKSYTEPDEE